MSKQALKQELLSIIHWFHAKGWAPATSTNYSFRNPAPAQNTYTISRSGLDKGQFTLEDFMEIDANGKPLEAYRDLKPSAETLLHTMLYEQPEVKAVLHTHSVVNTVFSWEHRAEASANISGFELLKGIAGITTHEASIQLPIYENSQDIAALSGHIRASLKNYPGVPGFLLAGHGLYAWGSSIAEAKRHIEVFEFLLDCLNHLEAR
ncbi:MAG: methylthioribulose 1-phosphate dehydratase [Bacteroidota bacterium]